MTNKPLSEKRTPLTYCLYALAMLIPCAYLLMWYVIQGHSFLSAKPYFSDEIGYWRLMYSIDNCGFGFGAGGGFAGNEAAIGPLGSHGLSPILAWGWYALLFPWRVNSIFAANFIMITASIGIFMLLTKPDARKSLQIMLLLLLYVPTALYINTAMMEIPCAAIIVIYSAIYIRWREKHEKSAFVAALVIGVYLGALRIFYIIVLLPLLWEKWGFRLNGKTIAKLALFAIGCLALYAIISLFMTPYPQGFAATLGRVPLLQKPYVLLMHTLNNLKMYFKGCFALNAEAAFRWMYLASMLYFMYKSIAKGERRQLYLSFFVVYAAMLAANIALYDVYGWLDYRMLSPSLLFALLFTISNAEIGKGVKAAALSLEALALCVTLITVIPAGTFVHEERFTETQDNKAAFAEVFGEEIASVSTMCEDGVFDRLKDIPPQIGIKWMTDEGGVIISDTEFIMIGGDDRELSSDYEFVGKPADKCYVYRKVN
jgi:hypothetical protein